MISRFFAGMMRSDKWDDMADGQMCWKMFLQCMKIANHHLLRKLKHPSFLWIHVQLGHDSFTRENNKKTQTWQIFINFALYTILSCAHAKLFLKLFQSAVEVAWLCLLWPGCLGSKKYSMWLYQCKLYKKHLDCSLQKSKYKINKDVSFWLQKIVVYI